MPGGRYKEQAILLVLAALLQVVGVLVYAVDRDGAAVAFWTVRLIERGVKQ